MVRRTGLGVCEPRLVFWGPGLVVCGPGLVVSWSRARGLWARARGSVVQGAGFRGKGIGVCGRGRGVLRCGAGGFVLLGIRLSVKGTWTWGTGKVFVVDEPSSVGLEGHGMCPAGLLLDSMR